MLSNFGNFGADGQKATLMQNPHLQTLCAQVPVYLDGSTAHAAEALRIPVNDGALLAHARWLPGARLTVLLVHGVAGTSHSRYMQRAAAACLAEGYHAVCLNLRGSGPGRALSPTLYHCGLTADLDAAVAALSRRPEVLGVLVIGFSLGGSMSLLAAAAPPVGLLGVASVSAPMDLEQTVRGLQRPAARIYHHYVLRGLKSALREHGQSWPQASPPDMVAVGLQARTVHDFDDRVMAPRYGFAGAAEYYRKSSCGPHLAELKLPCLIVHADDDPMVPLSTVLPYLAGASRSVTSWRCRHGGHIGFITGLGRLAWQRNTALAAVFSWMRERFQ
ncbi:MAG TPA: alpha/beta fold hydrolase [Pseudomonadota bacterium]|nr:alpha/beta fold hydrolase [Pseudomonadota bacterium]